MDKMIDITGISKAGVLAALYNASSPQGWGYLHADPQDMSEKQAQALLEARGGGTLL